MTGLDLARVSWVGLAVVLVSAAAAFSAVAIVAAGAALVLKRVDAILPMVLAVAIVFSGAVFPISTLPEWFQPVASILPPHLAFDGVRNALFRGEAWALDAIKLLHDGRGRHPGRRSNLCRALRRAKRTGSLAEY